MTLDTNNEKNSRASGVDIGDNCEFSTPFL
jgi:hypothetical protein